MCHPLNLKIEQFPTYFVISTQTYLLDICPTSFSNKVYSRLRHDILVYAWVLLQEIDIYIYIYMCVYINI